MKRQFNIDAAIAADPFNYLELVPELQYQVANYLGLRDLRALKHTSKEMYMLTAEALTAAIRADWKAFNQRRRAWRGDGVLNLEIIGELASKYYTVASTIRAAIPIDPDARWNIPLAELQNFAWVTRPDLDKMEFFTPLKQLDATAAELPTPVPSWLWMRRDNEQSVMTVALDRYLSEYLENAAPPMLPHAITEATLDAIGHRVDQIVEVLDGLAPLVRNGIDYWELGPWLAFDHCAQEGIYELRDKVVAAAARHLSELSVPVGDDPISLVIALQVYLYPHNEDAMIHAQQMAWGQRNQPDVFVRLLPFFTRFRDLQHRVTLVSLAGSIDDSVWGIHPANALQFMVFNPGYNFMALFWPKLHALMDLVRFFRDLPSPTLGELMPKQSERIDAASFQACTFDYRAVKSSMLEDPFVRDITIFLRSQNERSHEQREEGNYISNTIDMPAEEVADWLLAFNQEDAPQYAELETAIIEPAVRVFVRRYRLITNDPSSSAAVKEQLVHNILFPWPFYVGTRLVRWLEDWIPALAPSHLGQLKQMCDSASNHYFQRAAQVEKKLFTGLTDGVEAAINTIAARRRNGRPILMPYNSLHSARRKQTKRKE